MWSASSLSGWRSLSSAPSSGDDDDGKDGKDGKDKDSAADAPASDVPTSEEVDQADDQSSGESSTKASVTSSGRELVHPGVPETYPEVMVLPISRQPLFPGHIKTVQVLDPKVVSSIARLRKRGQPYVGVFLTRDVKNDKDSIESLNDIYRVGSFASVMQMQQFETGVGATLLLLPHRRILATGIKSKEPQVTLNVENLLNEPYKKNSTVVKALSQEIISTTKDIAKMNQFFREQLAQSQYLLANTNLMDDPALLADFAASLTSADAPELQEVLESLVVEERMRKALVLLKKELVNARVQYDIGKEVEERITRRQREHFLGEQLKSIKKELGIERDDKEALTQTFRDRASKVKMPDAVKTVFDEELKKLASLEQSSAEFNVTRNYLDWLSALPWGVQSMERLDVSMAASILDEDHYGLPDIKERILEFIAVGKLRGTVEGKILCFVGPPGVGKTSIGKSIARTLGREFFRFSVGGLTDIAEIKGHRRTYVGAMPGKLVQCLKKTQKENPLVLIDEIDKIGRGHNGDPASALLEMLDPEQNGAFMDHYLDVPVDLSKVLFVCTANVVDTIPAPLLDRMELIRLSGYVLEEKIQIAERYLIPTARKAAGLAETDVEFTPKAIEALIDSYCRESGVRNLQKQIEKILRKVALKRVRIIDEAASKASKEAADGEAAAAEAPKPDIEKVVIKAEDLKDYVGNPVFVSKRMYDETPVGVIMGLAWTSMGGTSLYVEAVARSHDKGALNITGQLGDVMKESSQIAMTYAHTFLSKYAPKNNYLSTSSIHLHVPEGATPKDGPSAGVTMTCSLLSLAIGRPARPDVAMTGELSLTGKVMRIGGVKEKTIAALRSGVKHLVLPASNKADWDILEPAVKEGIEVHFVDTYDQLFPIVFGIEPSELAETEANKPMPVKKNSTDEKVDN